LGTKKKVFKHWHQKEKQITEIRAQEGRTEEELERDAENLVTIQELIDAVTKLQETPDSAKLEQIAEVILKFWVHQILFCYMLSYFKSTAGRRKDRGECSRHLE